MHVTVGVPREWQDSPGTSQRGLRPDLGRELAGAHASAEKPSGELRESEEATLAVDQASDRRRIAHRPSTNEIDVQAHLEVGLHARLCRRLRGRVRGHDERGRTDDAAAMRLEDPLGHTRR